MMIKGYHHKVQKEELIMKFYSENLKKFDSSAITCPYSTYCNGDLSKCKIATNYSNHRINFRLSEETKKMLNYDVNSPLPLLMY